MGSNQNSNRRMRNLCSNKVENCGMERPFNCQDGRSNWKTGGNVVRTDIPSLVYTGEFAAFLGESSCLEQTIFRVNPDRQYVFSFFAKFGEMEKGKKDGEDGSGGPRDGGSGGSRDGGSGGSRDGGSGGSNAGANAGGNQGANSGANAEAKEGEKEGAKEREKEGAKEGEKAEGKEAKNAENANQGTVSATSADSRKSSGKDKKGHPNHKDDLGLLATVSFVTRNMECEVAEIEIGAGSVPDNYTPYYVYTPVVTSDVIAVKINFHVSDAKKNPHVPHHFGICVDAVSLRSAGNCFE